MATDLMTAARGVVVLIAGALLVYWTYRRADGQRDDPVLRLSKGSRTGYASLLFSGVAAVAVVAGVFTVALWPEISARPELALLPAAVVAAHYVVELRERA